MPLRYLLIVPFVLQFLMIAGLTSWLVWQNKQEMSQQRSHDLCETSIRQIQSYLEQTLTVPHQLHQINLAAIQLELLTVNEMEKVGQYFWKQAQEFKLSRIDYASTKGELIGVEQTDGGTWRVNKIVASEPSILLADSLDRQGRQSGMNQVMSHQLPIQKTSWFLEIVQVGKPFWSRVSQSRNSKNGRAIISNNPVYTREGKLIGALRIEFLLLQFSQFLKQLTISPGGRIFILDRDGRLIASSHEQPLSSSQLISSDRLYATQSLDPLVGQTTQYLEQTVSHLSHIRSPIQIGFQLQGQPQTVQIVPWHDRYGLDWLIVLVMPESNPTMTNTHNVIVLGLAILLITMGIAWLTARWISQPILRLRRAVQEVAAGHLEDLVTKTQVQELDQLSASLNQMVQRLQSSVTALKTANATLEQRITQKTSELLASETKFAKVFWASPNAIAITTIEDGLFVEANERFCTLMEYELEEVIGSTSYDLDCWADRGERAKILQLLQQRGAVSNYACQLRTKSGRILDGEISAQILYLNDQAYLLLTSTDKLLCI